jgi:hypothetical protein
VLPKGSPVDLVRVDSIYNPVQRANFTVEETRVGQRTDFDRLTVLVETNGAVAPEEAIAYSAELARIIMMVGGLAAGFFTIRLYSNSGVVSTPWSLISIFLLILGVISFFNGLTLHAIYDIVHQAVLKDKR